MAILLKTTWDRKAGTLQVLKFETKIIHLSNLQALKPHYSGHVSPSAFRIPQADFSIFLQPHRAREIKNPPLKIINAPVRRIPLCFSLRRWLPMITAKTMLVCRKPTM